ncbi:MAG TPA: heme ABC exporter ATP-binding protein CcmA, partial [Anaerolineaceae bacterium]|nr:heme ABC exporter ATP-binding protein CcmA [Anaerolineaceae bacterium]
MRFEAKKLCKAYGVQRVLQNLDISLQSGELVCLLGPNGAGKSTLIRLLSGLLKPTAGEITIDGTLADFSEAEIRRRIGLILHQTFLYEQLTGLENLQLYARLYGTRLTESDLKQLMVRVGLGKVRPVPVRSYSRGMKQRLTIARALLNEPQILLLDEPYTGLDQQGSTMLNQLLIEEKEQQRIILITTHELSFIRQVASRFDILHRGK